MNISSSHAPARIASGVLPEAEVSLRVAFWLLERTCALATADIAIDGAHVRIAAHVQSGKHIPERIVFDIESFLRDSGWVKIDHNGDWRGTYTKDSQTLSIKSVHGFDVQIRHGTKHIKVECKGGALAPKGRSAAAIVASAIGQAITGSRGDDGEELWVAFPDSLAYENVTRSLVGNLLLQKMGIRIALVSTSGVRCVSV